MKYASTFVNFHNKKSYVLEDDNFIGAISISKISDTDETMTTYRQNNQFSSQSDHNHFNKLS